MDVRTKQRFLLTAYGHGLILLFFMVTLILIPGQSDAESVIRFSQSEFDSVDNLFSSNSRQRRDTNSDGDVTKTESENDDPKCLAQKHNFEKLANEMKNDKDKKLANMWRFDNETKFNLALAWAANNDKGNLLVLTSDRKLFVKASSTLWRSENNGRNWENWNEKVDNQTFRQDDGLQRNPHNPEKVYLISYEHFIYKSEDGGNTWSKVNIVQDEDKQKLTAVDEQLEFHSESDAADFVLITTNDRKLYVTYDNFKTPLGDAIKDDVNTVKWGTQKQGGDRFMSIYATIGPPKNPFLGKGPRLLDLERYDHATKMWTTILKRVATFNVENKFMYASIYKTDHPATEEDDRIMMISTDGGDTWDEAQLPTLKGDRFFSVLDMTEGLVFIHVDNPGDTGHGVLYTSAENGIVYSQSLQNHLFPNYNTVHDFYKIKSIRGVYLSSQMADDKSIHTVITYNLGGEWKSVKRPIGIPCENNENEGCSLQIHNSYSIHRGIQAKEPHSLEAAKGLVLIHGHVAANLQTSPPDVYLSTDGGYNFRRVLKGPHAYEIADSGGLLVAVPLTDRYAKIVKFSTDEGNCWHTYEFTKEDIKFTGLLTEPGGKSMTLSLWGYTRDTKKWTVHVIDFSEVVTRECSVDDYETWIPHAGVAGNSNNCVMGVQETFQKIKQDSWCRNGYYKHTASSKKFCECTKEDFECDFGFYRPTGSEECMRQPDIHADQIEICKSGELEKLVTIGYRRIPGNQCINGFKPPRKIVDLKEVCKQGDKKPIIEDLAEVPQNSGTGGKTIITAIIIILVMIVMAVGVFFGYKYVLLRRHKVVYRYSMLNQGEGRDDEVENALVDHDTLYSGDSDEEVEQENKSPQRQQTQQPQLRGYHDDSDDDLLA